MTWQAVYTLIEALSQVQVLKSGRQLGEGLIEGGAESKFDERGREVINSVVEIGSEFKGEEGGAVGGQLFG